MIADAGRKLVGRPVAVLAATLALLVAGCGTATGDDDPEPVVVVTHSLLGDAVRHAVGDHVDVEVLMPPGADPHEFEPSAAQLADLAAADLVVVNGLGFEAGLDDAVHAAEEDGVRVIELGPELDPLPLEGGSHEAEQDEHEDEEDHDHGELDPHWFTDPLRMAQAVGIVREAVADLDGVDADAVIRDGLAYSDEVLAVGGEVAEQLASIPPERRRLITNHDVFGYFAERYDLEVVGTVIPAGTTLAEPSSAELTDLVHLIRDTGVPAVFADTSAPDALADALAREAGRDIAVVELYSESLGPPGSEGATYLDVLRTNAARIAEALG